ncbi:ferritin family protein [Candidatus Cloacimonadota bacterium]
MSFFTKNEIVEMAVNIEKQGYTFYDNALKRTDLDADQRDLITLLRDEEKQHEITFLELRNKLDNFELKRKTSWEDAKLYIQSMVDTHIFSDPEKAINLAAGAKDIKELISFAIQFEKDTLLFFHAFRQNVEGKKAENSIDVIINEEASHIRKLQNIEF